MLAFVSLSCQAASPLELARRAVQAGDTNGDGMLDVAEFEKQLVTSSELVGAVFDALDVDRDGQLDAEPFQALEKEEKREKREKERKEKKRAGWYEGVVYTMDGEQIEVSDQSGSGFWPKVEHALGTSLGLFIESGTFTDTETDEDYEVEYKDYIESGKYPECSAMNGYGKYTLNFGKFKNLLTKKKNKYVDGGSIIFTCRENGL